MLVKFTTQNHPDIIMFGDIARELLKLMGHSATVPSAITAEDVQAYLTRLIEELDQLDESEVKVPDPKADDDEPVISLKQRAQPVIELFQSAVDHGDDVSWDKG